MKTIYLEIENKQDKQDKQIQIAHLWYDLEEQKLKVLQGGCLRFKYDLNKVKMIPYVEDVKIVSYKNSNNKEVILSWIKKHMDVMAVNINETSSKSIAVDVEDDNESYVLDLIDIAGFRYD